MKKIEDGINDVSNYMLANRQVFTVEEMEELRNQFLNIKPGYYVKLWVFNGELCIQVAGDFILLTKVDKTDAIFNHLDLGFKIRSMHGDSLYGEIVDVSKDIYDTNGSRVTPEDWLYSLDQNSINYDRALTGHRL